MGGSPLDGGAGGNYALLEPLQQDHGTAERDGGGGGLSGGKGWGDRKKCGDGRGLDLRYGG
jgi:hypothetical protein